MTGHHPFNDLRRELSPERRAENQRAAKAALIKLRLGEPRDSVPKSSGAPARDRLDKRL